MCKHDSGTLFSPGLTSVLALLLLNGDPVGLSARPSNTTCLAEDISPKIDLVDAFPGQVFDLPMVLKQFSHHSAKYLVAEKRGIIHLLENGIQQPDAFLDISTQVSTGHEQGLLGLALHPQYTDNGYFYVSYTDVQGDSVISRFSRDPENPNLADSGSEQEILSLGQPYSNHNGGNIEFGEDSFLYIGFGDGGSGGDPHNHGQDSSTWLGALLRIDVDTGSPYAIPLANPYTGKICNQANRTGECPEIYAHGLRNPWRWSFDSANQNLWLADVGQNQIEEVNLVGKKDNLGWRCYEGSQSYNPAGCSAVDAVMPVTEYAHVQGRCSVTGGYVSRGVANPGLDGILFYGDYCSGEIWGLDVDHLETSAPTGFANVGSSVLSFGQDNDGNIYVLKSDGVIVRIEENTETWPDPVPELLSQTGCTSMSEISMPAPGMIPYDINSPFWSDGAYKTRLMALPDGRVIEREGNNWVFPPGSVLMKTFGVEDKPVETRLLKRHPNGRWAGYVYEWNEAATEAFRVVAGKTLEIPANGGQQWRIPSESECLVCHTSAAGFSLGLEPGQLNKNMVYPSTGIEANQISTLSHIGMFSSKYRASPVQLARLPDPDDLSHDVAVRARSWLHSNCSYCHRPGGATNSGMDLRFNTPFATTHTCNEEPVNGGHGLVDPRLIVPGNIARSLVHFRANSRNPAVQMPPLASFLPDSDAMALLAEWIEGLQNCD